MAANLAANMKATAEGFVMDFSGQWQPEATMRFRAPECTQTMLPTTLGIPTKNNEEWASRFKTLAPRVWDAEMKIHDYMGVPDERRAFLWSSMNAMSPVGPFHNEYFWVFSFDEAGEKITKIVEFLDSKASQEFTTKLRESDQFQGR